MERPFDKAELEYARMLSIGCDIIFPSRSRPVMLRLVAEVERCWKRIDELLAANTREVERRRAAEVAALRAEP